MNFNFLKIVFSVILLLHVAILVADVGIAPGPFLVCPGESTSYSAFPASTPGCTYTWSVTNGVFSNGQTTISGNTLLAVTVTWNNVQATSGTSAPKGSLTVTVLSCVLPSGEEISDTENNIVIKTLNNVPTGNINGPGTVPANVVTPRTYAIDRIKFPNTGSTTGWTSSIYADSYQWKLPAGWQVAGQISNGSTPITGLSHSISVIPDAFSGGDIQVRGYSECDPGYTSNWSNVKPVTRSVAQPSAITGNGELNYVLCGEIDPITFTVPLVTGATSYIWEKPSGWSGSSITNTITLTPSGTSAGDITVRAKSGPYTSPPQTRSLTLEPTDPNNPPTISNPSLLCNSTQATYTLSNVPAGTGISWSTSANLSIVSQSGSSLTVQSAASGNGSARVTATLTIGGCNPVSVSKSNIWIGKPQLILPPGTVINGNSSMSCGSIGIYRYDGALLGSNTYRWEVSQQFNDISSTITETLYVDPIKSGDGYVTFVGYNTCGEAVYCKPVSVSAGVSCGPPIITLPNPYSCGGGEFFGFMASTYPNPTTSQLTLSIPNLEESLKKTETTQLDLVLYNFSNEIVYRGSMDKDSKELDLLRQPKGIYVLKVSYDGEVIHTGKIIKN